MVVDASETAGSSGANAIKNRASDRNDLFMGGPRDLKRLDAYMRAVMRNVRAKPRVPTPAQTAQGPGTGGVRPTRLRRSCLAKSTTYTIGSWRAGDNGRTPSPGCGKCGAPRTGPGGLPLSLRLSEGLGLNELIFPP